MNKAKKNGTSKSEPTIGQAPDWLTLRRATQEYGPGHSTWYRWRDAGLLKHYKLMGKVVIKREDIEKLIKPSKRGGR